MADRTIYKYGLGGLNSHITVEMPEGADVLTFQYQADQPCIWALVDTERPAVIRHFLIHGTGHAFNGQEDRYVGTAQRGPFVWHLFEMAASS